MSINNTFFQDEIFDSENFENPYYFPPVFSANDKLNSNDELNQFRIETYKDPGLEPGFNRMDASESLIGLGVNPSTSQTQATVNNQGYIQAYLQGQVGKFVRIEFLIGTNITTDRSGVLSEVGINYIVLTDASGAKVMCDLYAIKFVTTASPSGTFPIQG